LFYSFCPFIYILNKQGKKSSERCKGWREYLAAQEEYMGFFLLPFLTFI